MTVPFCQNRCLAKKLSCIYQVGRRRSNNLIFSFFITVVNEGKYTDIAECWRFACEVRQIEEEMMTELEKATKQAQKQQRLEKAKAERLKGNPPEDILIEYK